MILYSLIINKPINEGHNNNNDPDHGHNDLEQIECEADFYALMFVEKYKYNKNAITKFIIDCPCKSTLLKKRLDIINGCIDNVDNNSYLIEF